MVAGEKMRSLVDFVMPSLHGRLDESHSAKGTRRGRNDMAVPVAVKRSGDDRRK